MAANTNTKTKATDTRKKQSTYKGTIVRIILGSLLLLLGTVLMLAFMMESQPGLNPFAHFAWGLFGVFTLPFIFLILWAGALCLVSAYHAVSWRGFVLISLIMVFLAAFLDLVSSIVGLPLIRYYMDRCNPIRQDMSQFFPMLGKAYEMGMGHAGTGLIGMIPAFPFYMLLGGNLSAVLCVIIMIVFLFMLFRTNPLRLISLISDALERRRINRGAESESKPEKQKKEKRHEKQPKPEKTSEPPKPVTIPPRGASSAYTSGIPTTPAPTSRGAYQPAAYTEPDYAPAPVPETQPQAPIPMDDDDPWYPPEVIPQGDQVQQMAFPADDIYPLEDDDPYVPQPVPDPVPVQTPAHRQSTSRRAERRNAPMTREESAPSVPEPVYQPAAVPASAPAPISAPAYHTARVTEKQPESIYTAPAYIPDPAPVTQSVPVKQSAPETAPAKAPDPIPDPVKEEPASSPVTRKAPVVRIPDLVSSIPAAVSTPPAKEISGNGDEDDDDGLPFDAITRANWEMHSNRSQEREKISRPRMAMDDKPKLVGVDPVNDVIGVKHSIPGRDTIRTGDPEKRGMDGHEHMESGVQMAMSFPYDYHAPDVGLLAMPKKDMTDNTAEDRERGETIVNTLRSFKINSEVRQVMHGPAITRFAIQIAAGIKVSSVTGVTENIALELGTKHVRVEAPIQGTNFIGIEVPNRVSVPVTFREVLECDELRSSRSPLLVALGKDIAGTPILCDLGKMPHLLIAGSTGSGKSVCINSIICSLIYRASPKKVRLILVDPKQVELQVYNAIPHLLVPVVSDPKKAAAVLNWVVNEMFERYSKFSAAKVRNLANYNRGKEDTDEELPNIVVIIDEMADLMEVCRKDVEESIRRLAALARAAGIYMVVATQRPSVDVITGVIKNNIPSRIAFSVTSITDSRTIIDVGGAEKLLGKGDMLYKPSGSSPVRVQGCFLSDDEVNAICQDLAGKYEPNYNPDIQEQINEVRDEPEADTITGTGDEVHGGDSADFDDLLHDAIMMAVEDGQTSVSMLQRRLRVGYGRAGRLVDEMEKRGIISKSEGSKPRKTLMTREEYARLLENEQN